MARISTQTESLTVAYGEEKALEFIARAGFDCVDFSLFNRLSYGDIVKRSLTGPLFEPKEKLLTHYRELKRRADGLGIGFGQLHSPFPTLVPGHPEDDETMIEVAKRSIEIAEVLDSPYIVIHPVHDRIDRADYFGVNMDFYGRLAETAHRTGVGICLENMFRGYPTGKLLDSACSAPEDAIELIDALNAKYGEVFSFCLDVGHAHICGYDPAQYVRKLGSRLTTLHIQDNDGHSDRHVIPYLQSIDWDAFFTALRETGYRGTINFEADGFTGRFPKEVMPEAIKLTSALGRYFAEKYEL